MAIHSLTLSSPLGALTLFEDDGAVVAIAWGRGAPDEGSDLLEEAARQLNAYFDGRLRTFGLPLAPAGSAHQVLVWQAMARVPYGETVTYGELAERVGSNPRAVGGACGRNPIPIVLPCHRIVGAGGRLVGFSGGDGVETKRRLLVLEGAFEPEADLFAGAIS